MVNPKNPCLLKLLPNRVSCAYPGGAGIDRLRGKRNSSDGNQPEEWVASLGEGVNPQVSLFKDGGYSLCQLGEQGPPAVLRSILQRDPAFYLGSELYEKQGITLGFLLKILDPAIRPPMQVHPPREFPPKQLRAPHRKGGFYYILDVRPQIKPSIRLGFQHLPCRQEWKRIIAQQDLPAMDRCFEPIPVRAGELWYIPGGMPHAVGEKILALEIMDPSDLTVYYEFEREGFRVPREARFMGKGLDFCLDLFNYEEKTVEGITKNYRLSPALLEFGAHFQLEQLVGSELSPSFRVQRLILEDRVERLILPNDGPQVALVTKGAVRFAVGNEGTALKAGESLFIAGAVHYLEVKANAPGEICFVLPG